MVVLSTSGTCMTGALAVTIILSSSIPMLLPVVMWGFPKFRGTLLGAPIIRIIFEVHIRAPFFLETAMFRSFSRHAVVLVK